MKEYHKIDSVYKRDTKGKFILGEFSRPEFEYLKDTPWLWTDKIDGTNIRIMWKPTEHLGKFEIGGKTDNAQLPNKLVNHLQPLIKEWEEGITEGDHEAAAIFRFADNGKADVCLYGEGYGAGIQNGGNYSADQKFILFDVKIGNFWLERANVEDIGAKLGLDVVAIQYIRTLTEAIDDIAHGGFASHLVNHNQTLMGGNLIAHQAEGLVGTPLVPLFARNGDRIITKVKYKDFK